MSKKYDKEDIRLLENLMFKQSVSWLDTNKDREDIAKLNGDGKLMKIFHEGAKEVIKLLDDNYPLTPTEKKNK
jgi:hypothetical protein